jgi:hypothetical protein
MLSVAVVIMVVVCGHDVISLYVTQMQLITVKHSVTHLGAAWNYWNYDAKSRVDQNGSGILTN